MWYPEWRVLVVDDEPDVLQLTELVLRNMEVEGVPVRVFTAASKAEAIEVINEHLAEPMGPGLMTVALIDVVMETDSAGLELCDYIRNTLHNSVAQIYVRTGQPGIAPERDVIDRYDISGYFTKVEATEDKLYTMIKSGVRQFVTMSYTLMHLMMLNDNIASSLVSQEQIVASMQEKFQMAAEGRGVDGNGTTIWIDEMPVVSVGYQPFEADQRRSHLMSLPAMPLGPMGEHMMVDHATHDSLVVVPGVNGLPTVSFLGSGHSLPKSGLIFSLIAFSMRSLGMLWTAAGQRAYQPQ